jgi:flagellar hook-length control protein FliK
LQESSTSNVEALAAATRSNLGKLQQTGHVSMHMDLNPPELGRVHVQLVAHDHQINLRLVVQDESARHAVAGQVEALRQRLAEAGVTLGQVNLRHEGDGARPGQQGYTDERPRQYASTKNGTLRKPAPVNAGATRGGIDLMA